MKVWNPDLAIAAFNRSGLTKREVCDRMAANGLERGGRERSLRMLLAGGKHVPNANFAKAFADAVGVPLDSLFAETDPTVSIEASDADAASAA